MNWLEKIFEFCCFLVLGDYDDDEGGLRRMRTMKESNRVFAEIADQSEDMEGGMKMKRREMRVIQGSVSSLSLVIV